VRNVLHQAVELPPAGNDVRGQQRVEICDGVGTHIGFDVLETAVELGLGVVLRVPHLSFRLQGKDTHNFFVLKLKILPRHIAKIA
jgi:hypothetical protein